MRKPRLLLAIATALAVVPFGAAADQRIDLKICVTMPLEDGGDAVFQALESLCSAALQSSSLTADGRGRAHSRRALARLHRGAFKRALDDYDRAFPQTAITAVMIYGRGLAKLGLGDADGARDDILKARRRDVDVAAGFKEVGLLPFWPFDGPNPADSW